MLAGQPVKRGTMAHDHDVYMTLTDSAAQEYDAAAIELYAPRLEELATRDNHKLYLGILYRAQGIAKRLEGNFDDAAELFPRALEIFHALGTRWQSGRTLVELGELERTRHNPNAARNYFERAVNEFDALRAAPDASRARGALEEVVSE